MEFKHKPVLLEESIKGLKINKYGTYVDGTIGGAGHSIEILKKLDKQKGSLVGIDRDEEAIREAKNKLIEYPNVEYVHGNHDDIKEILEKLKIDKVDGVLLDLGVSSYQLDEKNRGFSYIGSNELDMRMDKTQRLTAKEIINNYKEEHLANIIYEYGEERFSRNIARNICIERGKRKIETTDELVRIIEKSIPRQNPKDGHPAKRTFQAIRIEVNNEIKPLEKTIVDSIEALKPKGRLCVITFHSLEDRIVKKSMNIARGMCVCPKDIPYCVCRAKKIGEIITKKPIVANEIEQKENSRAKSAKLRIFEKI